MEPTQTQQRLTSSSMCTPQSKNIFLVNKRYPVRVKPLEIFSNENPEDRNSSSEEGYTKDTISANREDISMSPETRVGSCVLSSTPNSARSLPKSILRSPKIGDKKTGSYSSIQSFVDSILSQDSSDRSPSAQKQETKSLQTTPRKNFIRISPVKAASADTSPVKPKFKRVTFASKLESHKILDSSESEIVFTGSGVKAPTIKLAEFSLIENSQPIKSVNNLFAFASEEISKIFSKQRRTVRPQKLAISHSKPEFMLRDPAEHLFEDGPIFNLSNRPTKAAFNIRTPLVMSSSRNLRSSERLLAGTTDNDKGSNTNIQTGKRQASLTPRDGSRRAIFNVFK